MIEHALVCWIATVLAGQTPLPGAPSAAVVAAPQAAGEAAASSAASTAIPGAARPEGAFSKEIAEARRLYIEKKYAEALALFQKVASSDPKNAEAYNGMGLCYRAQEKTDLSIAAFQKAIERDPGISRYYYNLGRSYGAKQEFDLAIIAYRKAIKDNPKYGLAHFELGNLYFMKKEFANAKEHYEKAASVFGEKTPEGEQALRNAIKSEMFMQRIGNR